MGFILFLLRFAMFAIDLYTWVLVIYALLSWFPGAYNTMIGRFIVALAEPYLQLFRRIPLNIGMIDFTVMIALIVLQFGSRLLYNLLVGLMF